MLYSENIYLRDIPQHELKILLQEYGFPFIGDMGICEATWLQNDIQNLFYSALPRIKAKTLQT